MSSYFQYTFGSLCGIPAITLEGTAEDYQSIRRRVQALSEYDLSWWTEALLPVVDQFIQAADADRWSTVGGGRGGAAPPTRRACPRPHAPRARTTTFGPGRRRAASTWAG